MITLTLTQALGLYALVVGIGAAAIWLYTEVGARRMYQTARQQHLWRCAYCGYAYLDEAAETLSQCPRCESYNESPKRPTPATAPATVTTPDPEVPRKNPSRRKRANTRRRGPRRRR